MSKAVFPCKDCKDRVLGCHSHCEKYIEAKALHNKRNEEIKRTKQYYDGFGAKDYTIRMIEKQKKNN